MGIAIQGGWPIAYASVSVNSNLLAAQVRYGIGTSYKMSSWLRIHFVVNDGNISRSGSFSDTVGSRHPIAVKSNLLRVGLGAEIRLKNKFTVQVIPSFNQLSTNYSIDNASSDLSLFGKQGDNLFYAIKPPYVISNTFSPSSSSNVKTWIGVQLNLLYRINFN
jgi:hypothetical protein